MIFGCESAQPQAQHHEATNVKKFLILQKINLFLTCFDEISNTFGNKYTPFPTTTKLRNTLFRNNGVFQHSQITHFKPKLVDNLL